MAHVSRPQTRKTERVNARIPVTLLLDPENYAVEWSATTTELSAQGARILTEATLTSGQSIVMRSCRGGAPVLARVVWVSSKVFEPTQAGLEFLN
jgi:hypothetical protein